MHASVGDRIEIRTGSLDLPPRRGVVRDVLGEHYLVDWNDGHQSLLFPGPDATVVPAQVSREHPRAPTVRAAPRRADPVERVMSTPVATVDEHDSLRGTAVALSDSEVGALVVMARGAPLGIISERDVVHALAAGGDPDEVWAADVIGDATVWASPTDSIAHVAGLMRDATVRHIPLRVDDTTVGMVSVRDILAVLLD